jgi:hypothetical protein
MTEALLEDQAEEKGEPLHEPGTMIQAIAIGGQPGKLRSASIATCIKCGLHMVLNHKETLDQFCVLTRNGWGRVPATGLWACPSCKK